VSRSWELFLRDIEEASLKVERRTRDVSFDEFVANDVLYDAVVRNLEVIGEAVKGIPAEVRERCPGIDWRQIAGLRDILAHAYFAIDDATLWDIIRNKIPDLVRHVRRLRQPGV
jgi:uncharacterized protein with HEPN domain